MKGANRHKVCVPTDWNGLRMDMPLGKRIMMDHGNVNTSLIFNHVHSRPTTNRLVPITRPRQNQASPVEASSAGQPQTVAFPWKTGVLSLPRMVNARCDPYRAMMNIDFYSRN